MHGSVTTTDEIILDSFIVEVVNMHIFSSLEIEFDCLYIEYE